MYTVYILYTAHTLCTQCQIFDTLCQKFDGPRLWRGPNFWPFKWPEIGRVKPRSGLTCLFSVFITFSSRPLLGRFVFLFYLFMFFVGMLGHLTFLRNFKFLNLFGQNGDNTAVLVIFKNFSHVKIARTGVRQGDVKTATVVGFKCPQLGNPKYSNLCCWVLGW